MKIKQIFRFQAFTSTLSCTLALVLIGLTVASIFTARNVSCNLRENYIVTLTLGGSYDALLGIDEGMSSQTSDMQRDLQQERFVKNVRLITADEVLQQQQSVLGGNPEDFLGFNPYYSEMEVEIASDYVDSDSLQNISKEIMAKYPLVSEVNYERDLMENLNVNLRKISIILFSLTVVFLIILFALISNTVRLSIYARRFHIHTMKLVGASWWFIHKPFLKRSFVIGLVSAIVASGILVSIIFWMQGSGEEQVTFMQSSDIARMLAIVFLSGMVFLLGSTFLSVNHFLKMKEHKLHS